LAILAPTQKSSRKSFGEVKRKIETSREEKGYVSLGRV